jgi:serine/threonine protein kinase
LKPENILMDIDGYIKVSDYGLAKELPAGGKTHSFVGTPEYVGKNILIQLLK